MIWWRFIGVVVGNGSEVLDEMGGVFDGWLE